MLIHNFTKIRHLSSSAMTIYSFSALLKRDIKNATSVGITMVNYSSRGTNSFGSRVEEKTEPVRISGRKCRPALFAFM